MEVNIVVEESGSYRIYLGNKPILKPMSFHEAQLQADFFKQLFDERLPKTPGGSPNGTDYLPSAH